LSSINNVVLVGRVSRDPEIRHFESGKAVAEFGLAVQRPTKEKQTDFFEVKVWGEQVNIVSEYVRKGHLVGLIGRLEVEKWETQNGDKRSKVVVNVQRVQLMPNEKSKEDSSDDYDPFA
jgi:single-strand DNA-binding protein